MKRIISFLLILCLLWGNLTPAAQASQTDPAQDAPSSQEVPATAETEEPPVTYPETGGDAPVLTAESGDFSYSISGTNCTILGYSGSDVDVVIPETLDGYTVTAIGVQAFYKNTSIQTVTMPEGITSIGYYAFYGCTAVTSIHLADSITTIAYGAFQNCSALETINYPRSWSESASKGASYNYGYIFSGCTKLTCLEIPEGVTSIPDRAFQSCPNFVEIKLPSTLRSIGSTAFYDCSALTQIDFPNGLTSIGSSTFSGCNSLEIISLPDSLTSLGGSAFSGCGNITEVSVPGSVATIGASAFLNCKNLKTVRIGEGSETIGNSAFSGCSALSELSLPSTLTTIGASAFSGCSALVNVQLPDSVTSIAYSAFKNCSNLETINYPLSWTSAPPKDLNYGSIFAGCTKLTHMDIPEGVTTIPFKSFVNCTNFTSITFPSTLQVIDSYAFSGCSNLSELSFPDGLADIGSGAFHYCDSLTEIVLPGSLKSISGEAFQGCSNLQKVTIGEGCTQIGRDAFSGCTALEELHLPATLTTIGYTAFNGCTSLVSVQLPDSITSIGYGAFKNCSALTDINFPLNWTKTTQYNDGNYGRTFQGCTSLTRMVIPEGVKTIPYYAFSYANGLKEVVLPSTLETIDALGFYQCTALETVNIPESVTTIGRSAFAYCSSLKAVTLCEGATIGEEAFMKCAALTEITVPASVSLGSAVFAHCNALQRAVLEEGITQIPQSTFYNCTALYHVALPESLTSIGGSAFGSCTALTAPILPDALKTIGGKAFNGCTNLKTLFIPNAVTSIGSGAFTGCTGLTLYCGKQSYGASYAISQGIALEFYDTEWMPIGLDRNNSWFRINLDSVSASGYLSVITGYSFLEETAPRSMELYFYIPKETQLIESTLTLDGATCTNYTVSGTTLTVPVTETAGTVRFSLKPTGYARVTTYAGIRYKLEDTSYDEVIDTIYVEMPILSISAVGETASDQVTVSGVARPGSAVTLYVEEEQQLTVTANKAGDYTATVILKNLSNGKRYDIIARANAEDGTLLSSRTVVTYREDSPTVTLFNISHNGRTVTSEGASASRPVLVFNPARDFRFEVDFDVTSAIAKVFIVSTRNNISKFLVAHWNEETGTYIAEGYFDEENRSYVPGVISVQYILKSGELSIAQGYDFTAEEAVNDLPDTWQDATVEVLEDTQQQVQYVVNSGDGSSVRVTTTQQTIPEGLTPETAEAMGYTRTTDRDGTELYVRRYEKPDAYEYDVVSFAGGYAVKQVLDKFMGHGAEVTLYELSGILNDGAGNEATYQQMAKDIYKSPLSTEEKQAALEELAAARECNAMINITRTVFTVATPAIEAMALAALAVPGIGTVLSGALLVVDLIVMDAMLEAANDITLWRMSNMMYQLEEYNYTFIPRWVIDPSGYVCDAETQERIAGAVVTAYWIPYDETNEAFWDNVPAEDNFGQLWDASEYSQRNPLNTDLDGRYAWDVPEGWWRVKCEADCYETAWSPWLPVPPPQMDVNIALTPGDHAWDEGTVTKEPTEEEPGEKIYTCTRCGKTKTEVISDGVIRLSGKNRILTSFAVANQLKERMGVEQFSTVVVAYSQNFPDALAGSYLAAKKNAPILLTSAGSNDNTVLDYLKDNLASGGTVYILGGTAAVTQVFEDGATSLGFRVERLKGSNRYLTNLEILKEAGISSTDEVLIATGTNFADSLSASATGLPIVLVGKTLTQDQKDFLATTSRKFVIIGGTGAVSEAVETELAQIGAVERIKGKSRYETSVVIAQRYFTNPTAAILAYAQDFPDGLCGGPLAYRMGAPLILTSNGSYVAADAYIEGILSGAVTGGTGRLTDETVRDIFDLAADTEIPKK